MHAMDKLDYSKMSRKHSLINEPTYLALLGDRKYSLINEPTYLALLGEPSPEVNQSIENMGAGDEFYKYISPILQPPISNVKYEISVPQSAISIEREMPTRELGDIPYIQEVKRQKLTAEDAIAKAFFSMAETMFELNGGEDDLEDDVDASSSSDDEGYESSERQINDSGYDSTDKLYNSFDNSDFQKSNNELKTPLQSHNSICNSECCSPLKSDTYCSRSTVKMTKTVLTADYRDISKDFTPSYLNGRERTDKGFKDFAFDISLMDLAV